jgi:hypothetical protein
MMGCVLASKFCAEGGNIHLLVLEDARDVQTRMSGLLWVKRHLGLFIWGSVIDVCERFLLISVLYS